MKYIYIYIYIYIYNYIFTLQQVLFNLHFLHYITIFLYSTSLLFFIFREIFIAFTFILTPFIFFFKKRILYRSRPYIRFLFFLLKQFYTKVNLSIPQDCHLRITQNHLKSLQTPLTIQMSRLTNQQHYISCLI